MKRGEVYNTHFDQNPAEGEQGGLRPSVIVQTNTFTEVVTTVIVVPITTNLERLKLNSSVPIRRGDGGLPENSAALTHQVRVISKNRLGDKIGDLSVPVFDEIRLKLAGILGISIYYKG